MMLKTVSTMVVDDDPDAIELLCGLLEVDPRIRLVGTEVSPVQALKRLKAQPVDLLFLDVDMPEISGIELASSLHPKPIIIFTTAYANFAMDAYEMGLPDCIPKPVRLDRLSIALHRVLGELWNPDFPEIEADGLILKEVKTSFFVKIQFKDILFTESDKNNVFIGTREKRYHIRLSYKELSDRLPHAGFIQIHRGFLIAKHQITQFSLKDQLVYLKGVKKAFPVSRHYLRDFQKWFNGPG